MQFLDDIASLAFKLAKFMFYLQREPTPVWVVANRIEEKGLIVKSKEEFCSHIEILYDKYRPSFENVLYQTFYDFVIEVICKGICNATIEKMFSLISDVAACRLKHVVRANMQKISDFLAASEDEGDSESAPGSTNGRNDINADTDCFLRSTRRKNTGTDIAAADNRPQVEEDGTLENEDFEYFEKVYQGTCLDEVTETTRKPLGHYTVEAIVIQPFNTNTSQFQNSQKNKDTELPNVQCVSEIQGQMELGDVQVRSIKNSLSRSQSIVIAEQYIAPILIKQMKQETKITEQFKNLVEQFVTRHSNVKETEGGTERTSAGKQTIKSNAMSSHPQIDQANSSTKSSMRKKMNYKIQYQKKIRMGMLMVRSNPYTVRRKG